MKKGKVVVANINIAIQTNAKTDKQAIKEAENYELPDGYIVDSFEIVRIDDVAYRG